MPGDTQTSNVRRFPVFGPPKWAERLRTLLTHNDHHPIPLEDVFIIHELIDGVTVEVRSLTLTAHQMNHDAPCYGVRIESDAQSVAYSGDTGPCRRLEELASSVDLLIRKAGYGAGNYDDRPVHLTATKAGEVAACNHVRHLLLAHLAEASADDSVVLARQAGAHQVSGGDTRDDRPVARMSRRASHL